MTKISILLEAESIPAKTLMAIHNITDIPMLDIKKTLREKIPFFQAIIFSNDHFEKSQQLMDIIKELENERLKFEITEQVQDEDEESYPITVSTLFNILKQHEKEIKRQMGN